MFSSCNSSELFFFFYWKETKTILEIFGILNFHVILFKSQFSTFYTSC